MASASMILTRCTYWETEGNSGASLNESHGEEGHRQWHQDIFIRNGAFRGIAFG